jgi:hypothetical protein
VAGTQSAQSRFAGSRRHPLHHQLTDHTDKSSIGPYGSNPMELDPKLLADPSDFFIKVVKHFHVVRHESDRLD